MRIPVLLVCALLLAFPLTAQVLPQAGWPVVPPDVVDPPFPNPAVHNACVYDVDSDAQVEVFGTNVVGSWMWQFEPDGTLSPTWTYTGWLGPPAMPGIQFLLHFGDITGDGVPEIVFANEQEIHEIYALSATGEMLPGWPLQFGEINAEVGRIVLADLTGDGTLEVIVQDRWLDWWSRIWVFDAAGNVLPGWPQTIDGYATGLAVGDLEFDGESEIVACGAHPWNPDGGPFPIYVFDFDGNIRDGWPVTIPPGPLAPGSLFDIGIADLDGDYLCEIFGPGNGVFYILRSDGTLACTPIQGFGIGRPAAVGDLEGDGLLELVIPANGIGIFRLWNQSFVNLPAFGAYTWYDGVVIADTDGDGICEIGGRSSSPPALHLWNTNLQPLPDWPKLSQSIGTSLGRRVVSLADLDADGDLEMVAAARFYIECWDIPNPSGNPLRIEWGTYNHDGQRTGNYHYGRPPPGPRYLRGDADGDGAIRFGDAFVALDALFFAVEHDCPARLDWDADDALALADLLGPLYYLFGGGAPPEPPFPTCGMTDPGPLACERQPCP